MTNEHRCFSVLHPGHRQASATFLGVQIQAKLRDQPTKDIQNGLCHEFGLHVSYSEAYCARDEGLEAINGTEKELYDKMSEYCEDLKRNNPGSTIVLECTPEEDSRHFKRVFICHNWIPILSSGPWPRWKSKYQVILLTVTATDANESLFPLAYIVINAENDDN